MTKFEILQDTNSVLNGLAKWAKTDKIAINHHGVETSFKELSERSDAIAVYLLENFKEIKPVVVWCDKEPDAVAAIFGCLKSGFPYAVISSYYPQQRIDAILNVCDPCVIFAPSVVPFTADGYKIIHNDEMCDLIDANRGKEVNHVVNSKDIAAIVFTSGSTGVPKGVEIPLECISYWADGAPSNLPKDEQPRIIDISNYSFVAAFGNLFLSLAIDGATLYTLEHEITMNYQDLIKTIFEVKPHTIAATPTFLSLLLQYPDFNCEHFSNVTFACVVGETLSSGIAKEFLKRFPNIVFFNGYGCTESCSGAITLDIKADFLDTVDRVPIGVPSKRVGIELIDDDGNIVADGETGEIVIYGPQVTKGYYKDPVNTEKYFFMHESGYRAYKTRDLAYVKDGYYYYAGRKDNLIKVGGYRVEAEEVEYNLRQIDIVKTCAVAPATKEGRTLLLTAYVVLKDNSMSKLKAISHIKKAMGEKLQSYMVPQKVAIIDALPANANGKIDRVKLKEMSKID